MPFSAQLSLHNVEIYRHDTFPGQKHSLLIIWKALAIFQSYYNYLKHLAGADFVFRTDGNLSKESKEDC